MEIIVKKSSARVDPKRPQSHPGYEAAVRAGKKRASQLKFENEAAHRDYMKALEKNPNNVYGMPPFYPPLPNPRSFVSIEKRELSEKEIFDRFREKVIHDTDLFCRPCDRVTSHSIGFNQCFCHKCGTQKNWRLI